ncbi:uncharacterized protein AMSG_10876 [Thecamonas trahens ATCC 50062]|uniref:Uncharacterized protein n=1 Tax=Thecamonas trahens ATCC 50062 TaxID=461836 RepID=A0A0L0DSQ6_THETB|nr:hypothetical protein AMSG_10876 [Thecamonas trahens ATCC 50062]KNC55242.1 hypothetical protein AMSG_10876 [Thecamonas trahens ATCC 50062]|eukprot:XP_013753171.1 hypothetical protein AMSG_10876 [Thecamonas trahens ATCC 50062]
MRSAAPAALVRFDTSGAFRKRERSIENEYFSRKDHEALLKLKEKIEAANAAGAELPEEAHDLGRTGSVAVDPLAGMQNLAEEPVSMEDLMTLRKELLDRIQALEEVVGQLKYRQGRLLMKTARI